MAAALFQNSLTVTAQQLEAMLNLDLRTIQRLRKSGEFPGPDVRAGRRLLWRVSTVEKWVSDQAKQNAAFRDGQTSKGRKQAAGGRPALLEKR
jgi:predicted DNA-binding transcriptional regulator AlpA